MALAGEYQIHITRNVFNVLGNRGFLRDQGILSLESVQEFYKIIDEEPRDASKRVANLLYFCSQAGYHELSYKPVITLTNKNSRTGETQCHNVVLDKYDRDEEILVLTTIDSLSETGQTFIICPILEMKNGEKKLLIGGQDDQWCLGSDSCYVFYFN